MRNISELSSAEKVQVHFMFREMKHGFVQIAKMYDIRATNVINVINEVDEMRDNHLEALTREPVVYRKHFVNPKRHQNDGRFKARKRAKGKTFETLPSTLTPEKSLEISRASANMPARPTREELEALLNKFNKK